MNRRAFIRNIGSAILGGAMGGALGAGVGEATAASAGSGPAIATRPLGRTGHRSSLLTFGGYALGGLPQAEADRAVAEMIDAGVNAFDVAPSYGDAEAKLGRALAGKRDRVFLHCKTLERSKEGAARELDASLRRLRTDRFDLYQLHGLNKPEELEQALGPGGAMEAFREAREAGRIRFIGITGHRPATLVEAMRRFPFDTVMVPVNFVLEHDSGFAAEVLAEAKRRDVGVIAIKAMAAQPWPKRAKRDYPGCWYQPLDDDRQVVLALRFTLSQPVATAIPPADMRLHRKALAAVRHYRPITASDETELERLAAGLQPIFT
jgi:predicted aldo/keto reductase-like oxidoreductase